VTELTERAVVSRVPGLIDEKLKVLSRRDPVTVRPGTSLQTCLELLDAPDIKKSFDAMTKWDVLEAVSIRYLGGMAELSHRAKMAEAGRRLLSFVGSSDFPSGVDPDTFRSEARPMAAQAEAWIAAYRLTQEGRNFPGVDRSLRWAIGLQANANRARIPA